MGNCIPKLQWLIFDVQTLLDEDYLDPVYDIPPELPALVKNSPDMSTSFIETDKRATELG